MIHVAVEASRGGFTAVNGRVHDRLREWLSGAAGELLIKLRQENRAAEAQRCMNTVALLLQDQGKLCEAAPLFQESLQGFRVMLGDLHPDTLSSINNNANLLRDQGKLDEAENLFLELLRGSRQTLGDTHQQSCHSAESKGQK